jgi:hypothetical protein
VPDLAEQAEIGAGQQLGVGGEIAGGGIAGEVERFGGNGVGEQGGQPLGNGHAGRHQVLGHDAGGVAPPGPDVEEQAAGVGRAGNRMMIHDRHRLDEIGHGHVAGPRRGIDENGRGLPPRRPHLRDQPPGVTEVADELAVFGAGHHAAEHDLAAQPKHPLEQQLGGGGRREGIRVGIIMGNDEDPAPPGQERPQPLQIGARLA